MQPIARPAASELSDAIASAFSEQPSGIQYALDRSMRRLYLGRHVMRTSDPYFRVERYASAGHCELSPRPIDPLHDHRWYERTRQAVEIDARILRWGDETYEMLDISWPTTSG